MKVDLFLRIIEFIVLLFIIMYTLYKTWDTSKAFTLMQSIMWRIIFFIFMVYNLYQGEYISMKIFLFIIKLF